VFVRTDLKGDNRVPVTAEAVVQTRLCTVIANDAGVTVATIEHLMAALAALEVDNAVIEVDGPEVPIMDGSALPFVQLLDRARRRPRSWCGRVRRGHQDRRVVRRQRSRPHPLPRRRRRPPSAG